MQYCQGVIKAHGMNEPLVDDPTQINQNTFIGAKDPTKNQTIKNFLLFVR
jgi:hypothetical protein